MPSPGTGAVFLVPVHPEQPLTFKTFSPTPHLPSHVHTHKLPPPPPQSNPTELNRIKLAKSCACFCQSARFLLKHPHTIAGAPCTHRAQTTTRNFYFLQSQSTVRHSCQMSPSDSTSYTTRRRSCKLCSAGVLIVNPDALPFWFSALTFHLKVNLSVCSMCLKKSSKLPCRGAPCRFL